MFSIRQKREISEAVQKILAEACHAESSDGEIEFHLHVKSVESRWADIKNNGAVQNPSINPHNEMMDKG